MATAWTSPEQHLFAELAVGIARRLERILGTEGGAHVGPGNVHHIYTSDFENGCSVLWRLGVAHAAYGPEPGRSSLAAQEPPPERIFPPFFKFLAPDEIRRVLSDDPPASPPSLHEELCAYLAVVSDYDDEGSLLSSRREPFVPPDQYTREIGALERTGYLERRGAAVIWTDKIAPAMQEVYLWLKAYEG